MLMSTLLPFAHAWMWLGLAVSSSVPATSATPVASHVEPVEVRGTYGNHGVWLSLTGVDATDSDLLAPLRNEPRVEKADYIVVDLRGDSAALAQASQAVIENLWGRSTATSSPRRLKADARAYVITDGNCASACERAVALWKARGAIPLELPGALARQGDVALEAWVLAVADNPPVAPNMAARAAASP